MTQDMNRFVIPAAIGAGSVFVGWIALGFVGTSYLALCMTLLIGAVYAMGLREMSRYRASTNTLRQALTDMGDPLESLAAWLARVPAALQPSVRARIEGERVGLPGPSLTPYLVGLLVMLGMLGTFLGMVMTFKGAVFALEGSADLQAIRAALAAPIKGLGLSFGTSVAGVATSALLGLVSALCRRERLQVTRLLDTRIATVLRPFTLAHQREAGLLAQQQQVQALPVVAEQLARLMEQIEQRNLALNTRLEAQQQAFHADVSRAYTGLATAVGQSLQDSLLVGAKQTSEAIVPVMESALQQLVAETRQQLTQMREALQAQLQGVHTAFREGTHTLTADWARALNESTAALQTEWQRAGEHAQAQQQALARTLEANVASITEHTSSQVSAAIDGMARVLAQSEALVTAQQRVEATWAEQQQARMDQLTALWRTGLNDLRAEEAARSEAATARISELTLQLRTGMSQLDERDTLALQERQQLMERLHDVLQSAEATTQGQRAAIDTLVANTGHTLLQVQEQFSQTLALQADKADHLAGQVGSSAAELSHLGSSFQQAVELFVGTSEQLVQSLQGVEAAVSQSMERSDEQLAYYVAQAREVIDLSLSSQKAVVEDLRKLRNQGVATAGTA